MLKSLTMDGKGWEDEEGCYWKSRLEYMCIHVLHTCGCGDPSAIARYVLMMLERHTYDVTNSDSFKTVCKNNSYDDLPLMFFLSWADHEGYTEHGTTMRLPWRTEKGEELMRDLYEALKEDVEEEENGM